MNILEREKDQRFCRVGYGRPEGRLRVERSSSPRRRPATENYPVRQGFRPCSSASSQQPFTSFENASRTKSTRCDERVLYRRVRKRSSRHPAVPPRQPTVPLKTSNTIINISQPNANKTAKKKLKKCDGEKNFTNSLEKMSLKLSRRSPVPN